MDEVQRILKLFVVSIYGHMEVPFRWLNYSEVFQCFGNSVVINGSSHIVCRLFHFLLGIAHGYTDSGMAQHTDIVTAVTERHRLFQLEAETGYYFIDTFLLRISFCRDICKSGRIRNWEFEVVFLFPLLR